MRRRGGAFALIAFAVAALAGASGAAAAQPRPLATAIVDDGVLGAGAGAEDDLYLGRIRAAGATFFRTMLVWHRVAPVERPPGFRAEDPGDPAYDWRDHDNKIRLLLRHGLQPIVQIMWPPEWAGGGPLPSPDPAELASFARAAAERYSGSYEGLPRVRYWMLLNEPNVAVYYYPQFVDDELVSPRTYRVVVNAAAREIHAVRRDNVVITGALSPFEVPSGYTRTAAPMRFMRDFLCMSAGRPPIPTCDERAEFDVWAHNPYTMGGPSHRAEAPDDASLGDLAEMRELLTAAVRAGHVVSRAPPRYWATEFSWDSNPPDPRGLPLRLHARWVSEALYRMWNDGIDLVAWLELRDGPYPGNDVQAGLYFRGGNKLACDEPKEPTLAAFRFPFVAFRDRGAIRLWGRTPAGRQGRVVVERAARGRWKTLAVLATNRFGVFTGRVRARVPSGFFTERRAAPPSYRAAIACDEPADYWCLGERAGTTARDELGPKPGTYSGSVTLGIPGALVGDHDTAVELRGDGRIAIPERVWSPQTVELWLRTSTPANVAAFSNRDSISGNVFVGLFPDGRAHVFDGSPLLSAERVDDGRWHHLVYTYRGTTGKLYVDGRESASGTWERVEGAAPASIGFDASLQTSLQGAVDEVALYYRPLTPADIERHYRAGARPPAPATRIRGPYLRARLRGSRVTSAPFSLVRVPDRPVEPFGS
jgi:hypothetical protein